MDLINSAVGFKQAETASNIQIAVARKILQSQRQEGDAVIKLINAANQGVFQKGDELVAAATGLGGQVDTTA